MTTIEIVLMVTSFLCLVSIYVLFSHIQKINRVLAILIMEHNELLIGLAADKKIKIAGEINV